MGAPTHRHTINFAQAVSLSDANGKPPRQAFTFQQIHEKIGAIIQAELAEYKQKKADADKPPDEPPLIIL